MSSSIKLSSLLPPPALTALTSRSFSCHDRVVFLCIARGYPYRQLGERSVRSLGFLRMSHFFFQKSQNLSTSLDFSILARLLKPLLQLHSFFLRPDGMSLSQQGSAERQRNQAQDRQGPVQKTLRFQMRGGKHPETLEDSG